MVLDIYRNMQRHIEIGPSLGKPLPLAIGHGQGGAFFMLVAIMLVSVQFSMINDILAEVQTM